MCPGRRGFPDACLWVPKIGTHRVAWTGEMTSCNRFFTAISAYAPKPYNGHYRMSNANRHRKADQPTASDVQDKWLAVRFALDDWGRSAASA
jgi:hypothetical protein